MIRYEVKQKPIEVVIYEVVELIDDEDVVYESLDYYYSDCILDGEPNFKASVTLPKAGKLKVGDFAYYDVVIDEFRKVDLKEFDENPKLIRV